MKENFNPFERYSFTLWLMCYMPVDWILMIAHLVQTT